MLDLGELTAQATYDPTAEGIVAVRTFSDASTRGRASRSPS